jgi:hypothetical protein
MFAAQRNDSGIGVALEPESAYHAGGNAPALRDDLDRTFLPRPSDRPANTVKRVR